MYARAVLLFCLLGVFAARAQTSFSLKDLAGNKTMLSTAVTAKARVYVFVSPECPLCQSYSLTLRNIYDQYRQKGIEMIGIVPGTDFTAVQISAYIKEYKIPFTILMDEQLKVVQHYGATITPEVVVTDPKGSILYRGRIDNWAYELGKKRKVITEHNLKDALESILAGKPVKVSQTKAVGCFIE
jgi:peroxiredoxin